ncbi:MAG: cold-shock protein [Thermoplasmata archaeon]|nr:MAG: cold-shock protein [Thermoplasmata archaeon]HEC81643.1 cold shock domain-containing protein [Thermoplasmatales archaeon]
MKGTVKWFSVFKSYGFIEGENGKDVFVHQSALEPSTTLQEGDEVSFEIEKTDKGSAAVNVKKL